MEQPPTEPFKPAPAFFWEALRSPSLHVKLLGAICGVIGVLGLIFVGVLFPMMVVSGAALGAFSHGDLSDIETPYPWMFAYFTVPLIGGIGLTLLRQWARYLMVGFFLLNMLNFPFWTIVGGCGLVILLRRATARVFLRQELSPE